MMNFTDSKGRDFVEKVGPTIQGLLNGVKQTSETFATKHNLDLQELKKVLRGQIPPSDPILEAIDNHSPLRLRDLYDLSIRDQFPVRDDTTDGIIIFSVAERDKTLRTLYRGPGGKKFPYYDYADTAMSTTSLFRPEWIAERFHDSGNCAELPDWAFNKGHFEHQLTFFIGDVNFHWIGNNGKKQLQKMTTGEMNYNTPFIPHTFTTRTVGNGLILAVTYGGSIATEGFQSEIKAMSYDTYLRRIKEEIPHLDKETATDKLNGVIIKRVTEGETKGRYSIRNAMENIPYQPWTKAFEYIISSSSKAQADLKAASDLWGYNTGDTSFVMVWGSHEQIIGPGNSFFIKKGTQYGCGNKYAKFLLIQINPVEGNPWKELAHIYSNSGELGVRRAREETEQWF